jgi:hypothetical protein
MREERSARLSRNQKKIHHGGTETRRREKMDPQMHADSHRSFKGKEVGFAVFICVHLWFQDLLFSVPPCLCGKKFLPGKQEIMGYQ